MENATPPRPSKPHWLTKLEEESWQAELIISGLAIYGTLQLPETIEWLLDWCLASLDPRFFMLLYLFFTYLGIGAYVLIFIFIGHFVLRAVWIGLVGLNSVYPQGINEDSTIYAKHFLKRFRADHPDQNDRIRQLDNLCSVFFALGAQLAMIFMAINIDIFVIGMFWYLIDVIFGGTAGSIFSIVIFALFLLYTTAFVISNTKALREKPFVQRWQYPVYKKANGLFLHVFARPASYLTMVFQTNLTVKRYAGIAVGTLLVVFFFFAARFFDYRFLSFVRPERLYEQFDRDDRLIPEHYSTLRKDNRRLLSLELESDIIFGDHLRVFVPILKAESSAIGSICGEPNARGSEEEERAQLRAFYTDCYKQMHRFYINDSLYQGLDLIKYDHPNQGEEGILAYLPVAGLPPGKQVLRVEKAAPPPDSILRQMQAVFWVEKRE